uniref:Cytochrome P450 n=1 Tax=Cannabis sativa TaxID=3483 RepID=A0ABL6WNR0_CANSA
MKATLDSMFQVAFGVELDSMCGSSEEGKKFSIAFDDASAMTLFRYVDILWKIKKFLNIGSEASMKKKTKIINDFVFKIIHTKIELMESSKDKSLMKREDILSRFLKGTENDPIYLRDVILSVIIAGKDTTATTFSWFIYLLCKHPSVQDKVVNELRELANAKKIANFADFAETLSEEVVERMQYLHAAITETLRIYPAVPVTATQ